MPYRFLVLSADMGAGHDAVAGELARRLRAERHTVARVNALELLPVRLGPVVRGFYRGTIRHVPVLYAGIYRAFFRPGAPSDTAVASTAPLAALAGPRLAALARHWRPDVVVSTFHLAAQVTGQLRQRGALDVPSAVTVTDFAVHRQWLHPGNDMHLCADDTSAARVRAGTGRHAAVTGPVVPPAFTTPPDAEAVHGWAREFTRRAPGRRAVLIGVGAWGAGSAVERTAMLLSTAGYLPVVLCGHDTGLRRRAMALPGVLALGWTEDLPALMAASAALVDNAAGQTAVQALAAGLPVVGYRPIPGHGVEGVQCMADAGLSVYADGPQALLRLLSVLTVPGAPRTRRVDAGHALFVGDAATDLVTLAARPPRVADERPRQSAVTPGPPGSVLSEPVVLGGERPAGGSQAMG